MIDSTAWDYATWTVFGFTMNFIVSLITQKYAKKTHEYTFAHKLILTRSFPFDLFGQMIFFLRHHCLFDYSHRYSIIDSNLEFNFNNVKTMDFYYNSYTDLASIFSNVFYMLLLLTKMMTMNVFSFRTKLEKIYFNVCLSCNKIIIKLASMGWWN